MKMKNPSLHRIRGAIVVAMTSLLVACGATTRSTPTPVPTVASVNLDAIFPLAPTDPPTVASALSQTTAAALGRGVNLGNLFESPLANGDWGVLPDKTTDYLRFVELAANAGFTHVRVPVRWSNHASSDAAAVIDLIFAARVDAVIDAALARGLYVLMDVHHYRQLDGDALDKGEFRVADDVVELRFLNLWRQLSQRYANRSSKLLFELYNEPHGKQDATWNTLMSRALREVRQANPGRIVVVGPTHWNNANALRDLRLPADANLLITVHNYEPFKFTHQGAEWVTPLLPTGVTCCDAAQRVEALRGLDLAVQWSKDNRYPVHVGEFGAYSAAPLDSRLAYMRLMRESMEVRKLPWTYWELASGFGIYDPLTNTWRESLRDALLAP
jgi:endoglucanase